MPRLSGLDLIKRLRAAGNALPVVVSSGNFDTDEAKRHDGLRVMAILMKPFTPENLLETVQQVLGAPTAVRGRGDLFFPMLAEAATHLVPSTTLGQHRVIGEI